MIPICRCIGEQQGSNSKEIKNKQLNKGFITFQFSKIARRVRAKTPAARRALMFQRKAWTHESNKGLPSTADSINLSFFLKKHKAWGQTNAFRTEANASYAARQTSAPVWFQIIHIINWSSLKKYYKRRKTPPVTLYKNYSKQCPFKSKHTSESGLGDWIVFQNKFHMKS